MDSQKKVVSLIEDGFTLRELHELIEDLKCENCGASCDLKMKSIGKEGICCDLPIECECGGLDKLVIEKLTQFLNDK